MKILITGANGMLGSQLTDSFPDDTIFACGHQDLDITNREQVKKFIEQVRPDIIIHAAAYTNVEQAETDIDQCYLVNTIATEYLASFSQPFNPLFIYISSTGNYGAYQQKPFTEYDKVEPTTVYHKSKLAGEEVVRQLCLRYLILRTGWLFGGDLSHAKNFVYKRYLEAGKTDRMYSDPSQTGNPTNIADLIAQIKVLVTQQVFGTFNCVNEGAVTRLDYVRQIVAGFGMPCQVLAGDKTMFKRVAPVSPNEAALNFKLSLMGLNVMASFQDSLASYIKRLQRSIDKQEGLREAR